MPKHRLIKPICRDKNGEITVWYKDRRLAYREFKKLNIPPAIVSSKDLNSIVDIIKSRGITKPGMHHPWKHQSFLRMVDKKLALSARAA